MLLRLEYRRSEAEAMIAETLAASPAIRDAEQLLAHVYRAKNQRAAAS